MLDWFQVNSASSSNKTNLQNRENTITSFWDFAQRPQKCLADDSGNRHQYPFLSYSEYYTMDQEGLQSIHCSLSYPSYATICVTIRLLSHNTHCQNIIKSLLLLIQFKVGIFEAFFTCRNLHFLERPIYRPLYLQNDGRIFLIGKEIRLMLR